MATTLPTRRHWPRRAALAAALGAAGLALLPATAGAHVTVHTDSTASGSFSALTFRVPNESDTASTVKLEVQLPKDTPFLYVSSKPIPGWTVKMTEGPLSEPVESEGTKITKAISTVTWTASDGAAVKPGEYQDFSISAGPLPKPGTIELPAVQTYSDGEVVKWNQPTPASGEEPEYPVPTFVITAAEAEGSHTDAAPAPNTGEAAASPPDSTDTDSTDPLARGLAVGGILVGAAGVATAAVAVRRSSGTPSA
jgi:periplasmic copper chaperone A